MPAPECQAAQAAQSAPRAADEADAAAGKIFPNRLRKVAKHLRHSTSSMPGVETKTRCQVTWLGCC